MNKLAALAALCALLIPGSSFAVCKTDKECINDCGCKSIEDDPDERRKCNKTCDDKCSKLFK